MILNEVGSKKEIKTAVTKKTALACGLRETLITDLEPNAAERCRYFFGGVLVAGLAGGFVAFGVVLGGGAATPD